MNLIIINTNNNNIFVVLIEIMLQTYVYLFKQQDISK